MVGGVRYAVDIQLVQEIINPLPIVNLPHSPPAILGVSDHRGEVVPILDLRLRLGLEAAENTRRTKWVIVQLEDRSVGMVVDAVTDVFGAGGDSQREVPSLGFGDEARGIAAVHAHQGTLVFVIDVDRVAAPAEAIDMDHIRRFASGES